MAIPYRTAKFKSANILLIAIWGSTAKFNARQYFRLYGSLKWKKINLSLEPIFSSEDIIAQMPQEGRKFGVVDRHWKEVMGEAVKDHHALVVTAQDNMLDKLNESNVLLEEIQKGLNDYLEKKRLYFPRWGRNIV